MNLESYVRGRWQAGTGDAITLRDATTGEPVAVASSGGIDFRGALEHARAVGGPALRRMTFHERAGLLKALAQHLTAHKESFYDLSYATGATRSDSWIDIDGGIGTLFAYASRGRRELPNGHVYLDGGVEALSKTGTFVGQHVCLPLEGAALHINAFNFPVWGMLEKFAPALLAGVPSIVKPATSTAYLTERVVRSIVDSGLVPEGALQLICGGVGDLFEHLTCQDIVSFTGSASTAARLRAPPDRDPQLRALRGGDRLAQFVGARTRRGPGHAGVRPLRQGGRARDDRQGRPEVHGDPQGDRAGVVVGRRGRGALGGARESGRRRPAAQGGAYGAGRERLAARRGARPRARARGRRARRARRSRALRGERRRRASRCVRSADAAPLPRCNVRACGASRGGLRAGGDRAPVPRCPRGDHACTARRGQSRGIDRDRRRCDRDRAGARSRALPRAPADPQPALRQGVDRSRLAAAASHPRRTRSRRWRRGDGRAARRAAFHAAHRVAGNTRHARGRRRTLDPRRHAARSGRAPVPQDLS